MNVPALAIAACIGAAFFAAEYTWYYQPDFVNPDKLLSTFRSEHSKARAAVSRVLIEPHSAHFGGLRTVEGDTAKYVCGSVEAMDKEGRYVEAAFVYTVAIDFARIDDDGRITSQHTAYRPCPTAAADKIADTKTLISPDALAAIKTVEKLLPKSSGGTMEQQLGQLAGQTAALAPGSAAAQGSAFPSVPAGGGSAGPGLAAVGDSNSRTEAGERDELTWRADRPPATWPTFPSGHPLSKSTQKRTSAEALALSKDIEARWEQSRLSGNSTRSPAPEEIKEACRALLTVDPMDKEYPNAWAAFVRLRKIGRDAA